MFLIPDDENSDGTSTSSCIGYLISGMEQLVLFRTSEGPPNWHCMLSVRGTTVISTTHFCAR